jgi:hypothetical protein
MKSAKCEVSGPRRAEAGEIAHCVRHYSLRRRRRGRRLSQHPARLSSTVTQQVAQPFEPVGFHGSDSFMPATRLIRQAQATLFIERPFALLVSAKTI